MKSTEDRPGPLPFSDDYAALLRAAVILNCSYFSSEERPNSKTETLLRKLKMAK